MFPSFSFDRIYWDWSLRCYHKLLDLARKLFTRSALKMPHVMDSTPKFHSSSVIWMTTIHTNINSIKIVRPTYAHKETHSAPTFNDNSLPNPTIFAHANPEARMDIEISQTLGMKRSTADEN